MDYYWRLYTVIQYIANTTQGYMGMVEKIKNANWS
jgi:hypothetical protein